MADKSKLKQPGPFWVWIIAALIFAQIVKRGIIGWPLPKDFDFGSRFLDNFVANLIYGLPVIIVYLIVLAVMNLGKKDES